MAAASPTGNPNAPNGTQVAFLKNNASMSQTVYLDAGVYDLSFLAAQRVQLPDPESGNRGPGRWRGGRR